MAKAWQYPRWRYYLMQAVLWGVLGAMVGAAGLVNHHRQKALVVRLGAAQTKRNLTIQLPDGWKSDRKLDADSHILFQLEDPVLHRTLQIIREPHVEFISPAHYLVRTLGKPASLEVEPLMIAGAPGTLARATLGGPDSQDEDAEDGPTVQVVAAATVLPSGHAVSVRVIGASTPVEADADLVKRVAMSIQAHGEPKLSDEDLRLRDGTTIDLPDGYSGISQQDPNRSGREIRMQGGGATLWRGVTLIPVVILPSDTPAEISTLCTAWDSSWRPQRTRLIAPHRWRVDRAPEAWSDYAVSQIYVMSDTQGHGLMAVFEGAGSDASWVETLWSTLCEGTKFSEKSDLQARLTAGAHAVSQIREHGLASFLGEKRDERWWLYCHESPDHPIGWMHEEPAPSIWRQSDETRFTFPDRGSVSTISHWEGTPNLGIYESGMQHKTFGTDGDERATLRVFAKFNQGKLDLSATGTDIETKTSIVPSAAFLPGGWAGLLIGKLPEKPMILETESFSGYEGAATASMMRLIITPSSDVAHSGEADAKPLRCVNVEVNGSNEISRWFFRADGTLDSIDYANGFRRVRSDLSTIRSEFTTPGMKP